MNTTEQQNLEIRLRRLEQLHLWGMTAIIIGAVAYIVVKHKL